jgi:hypothetical protein
MHSSARFLQIFAALCATAITLMSLASCGGSGNSTPTNQGPTITTQPVSATISKGQTANPSVVATGNGTLTYQWYQGTSGDTATPVGTNSSSFSSPPLSASVNFWVNVSNSGGNANSNTATITVVTPPANAIPSGYFGMDMNGGINGIEGRQPWPGTGTSTGPVPFGAVRLWDASVSWSDLNAGGQQVYDWTNLDNWLRLIPTHNADVLYTFGRTPAWASSVPHDTSCGFEPGSCDPPAGLNGDGTGSDELWQQFVSDLVSHSVASTTGHIKYYELWNEADNLATWNGTVKQMVRMTTDAIQIIQSKDPSAIIVSPSVIIESSDGQTFLQNYVKTLPASGLQALGGIAFHGYVQQNGKPLVAENLIGYLSQMKQTLAAAGLSSTQLFDTEASWGDPIVSSPAFTDSDMQAGFVARMYLIHWSENVARFYWYQWNNKEFGTLWTPDPNDPSQPGTVLPPGVAYGQVYHWLVGSVMNQACTTTTPAGSVWTCELTSSNGYQALAVWDASQSCSSGNCSTSDFTFAPQYLQYRDVAGNTTSLSGKTSVAIGAKPILLENQTR